MTGQDFSVREIADHEYPGVNRKGIELSGYSMNYATCFESFQITSDGGVIERDVCDLYFVGVDHRREGQGIGTLLVAQTIHEIKSRGFSHLRFHPVNPRMIRIMEKLSDTGVVHSALYVLTTPDLMPPAEQRRTTEQIVTDDNHMTSLEAMAYLNSLPLNEYGMVESIDFNSVEGVAIF